MQPTTPSGSLTDHRQLGGLDRAGSRGPRSCARSRRSSRKRPRSSRPRRCSRSAACRPRASSRGQLLGARAQPRGHLVEQLAALDRRRARPTRGAASRAAATAASTCSASGEPTSTIVSSVAGFSTASARPVAGDPLAADQQSGLHRRSRLYGAASMALFTVSGLVKIWSGLASYTGTLSRSACRSRSARSLACASWGVLHVAAAERARLRDDGGGVGQLGRFEVRAAAPVECARCCSRTGGAWSGSRARTGS